MWNRSNKDFHLTGAILALGSRWQEYVNTRKSLVVIRGTNVIYLVSWMTLLVDLGCLAVGPQCPV